MKQQVTENSAYKEDIVADYINARTDLLNLYGYVITESFVNMAQTKEVKSLSVLSQQKLIKSLQNKALAFLDEVKNANSDLFLNSRELDSNFWEKLDKAHFDFVKKLSNYEIDNSQEILKRLDIKENFLDTAENIIVEIETIEKELRPILTEEQENKKLKEKLLADEKAKMKNKKEEEYKQFLKEKEKEFIQKKQLERKQLANYRMKLEKEKIIQRENLSLLEKELNSLCKFSSRIGEPYLKAENSYNYLVKNHLKKNSLTARDNEAMYQTVLAIENFEDNIEYATSKTLSYLEMSIDDGKISVTEHYPAERE